jgi:hypothetical protein
MDRILRFTSLLPVVVLCGACGTAVTSPDSPAAVMLGEWSYAAPNRISDPPILNTGLHVSVMVDSVEGMRFWGHVTLWVAGDVGASLTSFGRVWGQIDDGSGVMLEIPRTSPGQAAVRVVGELAGDVLTIHDCYSGADAGPLTIGATFERVAARHAIAPPRSVQQVEHPTGERHDHHTPHDGLAGPAHAPTRVREAA